MLNSEESFDPTIYLLGCLRVVRGKSHHTCNSSHTRGEGPYKMGTEHRTALAIFLFWGSG